ncbi:putative adenosine deaminase protein [Eutypa lata UCREL1]|uniref:Putative adenosine deaminase protein n=1 Tax=Eutypa lata (strain UCR-EL1) TaxID=1287681 RepID=M7TNE7_EUTLA|nr:putative adenosine deaminase protein [Eutypa lata UCREL1]
MPPASLRRFFHRDRSHAMNPAMSQREMAEEEANKVLQNARRLDDIQMFEPAARLLGVLSQTHERYAGDRFLFNIDLIDGNDPNESQKIMARRGGSSTNVNLAKSYLLQIAEKMPKGAHLHIHFNATLLPHILLEKAERMVNMYIWTSVPLVTMESFDLCEIQFSLGERKEPDPSEAAELDEKQLRDTWNHLEAKHDLIGPNIFIGTYEPNSKMRYAYFRQQWEAHKAQLQDSQRTGTLTDDQERILEAHNAQQSQNGIWEKFNGRTRMMKGLFNYETAFREYTRDCLEEFVRENVQYAEIRPNFMKSNQIWTDNGREKISNEGTVKIIIEEYEKFMKARGAMLQDGRMVENRSINPQGKGGYSASAPLNHSTLQKKMPAIDDRSREKPRQTPRLAFGGLKIIYCTPRSFPKQEVKDMLAECLIFKKRWPEYIAGFDLVGEESKGHPLSFFTEEFEEFVETCRKEKVQIPFLFHCAQWSIDHACMAPNERERVQIEWELRWDEFLNWINSVPEFRVEKFTRAEIAEMEKKAKQQEEKSKASVTASQAPLTSQPAGSRL